MYTRRAVKSKRRYTKRNVNSKRRHTMRGRGIFNAFFGENPIDCSIPGMTRLNGQNRYNISFISGKNDDVATCALTDDRGCPSYKRGKRMGANSHFGTMYNTSCGEDQSKYITKIVPFTFRLFGGSSSPKKFLTEFKLQSIAANVGISPKVRSVYLTKTEGIAIMERMPYSLKDVMLSLLPESSFISHGEQTHFPKKIVFPNSADSINSKITFIVNKIKDAIIALHKVGIFHGDLHVDNVMFNDNIDCMLIDYGISAMLVDDKTLEEIIESSDNEEELKLKTRSIARDSTLAELDMMDPSLNMSYWDEDIYDESASKTFKGMIEEYTKQLLTLKMPIYQNIYGIILKKIREMKMKNEKEK